MLAFDKLRCVCYDSAMFSGKRCIILALIVVVLGGIGYWVFHTPPDPRQLALGEWQEVSSRSFVDVSPTQATARGMLSGSVNYEWEQTEKEPYLVRFTYRHDVFTARVSFPDADNAVVEPDVWNKMSADKQRLVREANLRRNRPETEVRLLFKRVKPQQAAR